MNLKLRFVMGLVIIIALVVGVLFVLQTIQTDNVSKNPRLGGLFGLTGFASFAGESSRDGFMMAIEDYNKPVDYVIEDYQSDMKTTLSSVKKLIEVDDMQIIIGPEWEFGAVISPLAEEKKALFITPWLTIEPEWTSPEYFMSAMPREQIYTDFAIKYVAQKGVKKIAIIQTQDDFAITVGKTIIQAAKQNGITIIQSFSVTEDSSDYRSIILKINTLGVDAIYTIMQTDNSQAQLNKQLKELNIQLPIYVHYARAESDNYLTAAKNSAEGIIYVSPKESKKMSEFNKKFFEKYNRAPAISAATAYDITTLILKAHDEGYDKPEEVYNYLNEQKGYEGYYGTYSFENGFVKNGDAVMKTIENGKRIELE